MAKRYTVYTDAVSYQEEFQTKKNPVMGQPPVYVKRVNANSRLEALEKCLVDIRKEFPKLKPCKYLSVFVGETCNPSAFANRLHPIQVDITTQEIRKTK